MIDNFIQDFEVAPYDENQYLQCHRHNNDASHNLSSQMYIPKKIHRVWFVFNPEKPEPSEQYKLFDKNLRRLHPDYEFVDWDEDKADVFVKEHYPEMYETWVGYDKKMKKVDLFRYLILDKLGGIVVQHSINVQKNITPLFCGKKLVLFEEGNNYPFYHAGFIGSIPNHPMWQLLTAEKVSSVKNRFVIFATGPGLISEIAKQYIGSALQSAIPISTYSPGLMFPFNAADTNQLTIKNKCVKGDGRSCFELYPNSYGYTVWSGDWWKWEYSGYDWDRAMKM